MCSLLSHTILRLQMSDMDSINYTFYEKDGEDLEESEEKCERHRQSTYLGNGLACQIIDNDKCAVHNSTIFDSWE